MKEVLSADIRARLVELSCCHSGRGEIKAEGVVGIARAFLGAGARSVLVSLWAIDDEATLKFMESFYLHLVQQRSASEALNRTMRSMKESDEFHEVKYWAPFVLIGDDVTLDLTGNCEEMHWLACKLLCSLRASGAGKERRACNYVSGIFKNLHRKGRREMMIGGDGISNDAIALVTPFSMFVYIRSF